jgi:hypothetical protein
MSTAPDTRSPEEIRRDIEKHRKELGEAIGRLRGDVQRATDWRTKIVQNQKNVMIGAAVAGFMIGGGIAVIPKIFGKK